MSTIYLFLDIDGVLNRQSDWRKGYTIRDECLEKLISLLRDISNDSSVAVVFTSTWGRMLESWWKESGLARLEDVPNLVVKGSVYQPKGRTREDAVRYYLRRHNVGHHLILDDDRSLFPDTHGLNIVFTDSDKGLTEMDCQRLLAMRR